LKKIEEKILREVEEVIRKEFNMIRCNMTNEYLIAVEERVNELKVDMFNG
jgi:hypothetical protein